MTSKIFWTHKLKIKVKKSSGSKDEEAGDAKVVAAPKVDEKGAAKK